VQVSTGGQDRHGVDRGGVAFEHPVGKEDEPVAGAQGEILDAVGRDGRGGEGQVGVQEHTLGTTLADANRRGVPSVDDPPGAGRQVDADELAGDELLLPGVARQGLVSKARLLGQAPGKRSRT
jgi:hypothetical protein